MTDHELYLKLTDEEPTAEQVLITLERCITCEDELVAVLAAREVVINQVMKRWKDVDKIAEVLGSDTFRRAIVKFRGILRGPRK